MKSRTSFFNLTALRKNITRFAPVWALYLIGGLLIGLNSISTFTPEYGHGARSLANSIGPMAIINFLYAIIAAELLFGDLFNSRLCNALHAFPMRRESWFATHKLQLVGYAPEGLDILHESNSGRLRTLIVRGSAEEISRRTAAVNPVYFDVLPLSLEEIFIYELGGVDYEVRDIVL